MIIKKNSTEFLVTLSFLLILPFVQKQWFNLYLFNINNVSLYSILYYLSGAICPFLICLNSLNNYTYYNFNKNKTYSKNPIKGKSLFCVVSINLMILSYLIIYYMYINLDIFSSLFLEGINLHQPNIFQLSLLVFLVSILLNFKLFRILFKKLILGNFILISFYIWYSQINNLNIDEQFYYYKNFGLNNINLINVFILIAAEISYFTWSFLSYKTNLSDWIVRIPQKADIIPFLNMFIFYFFITIYYAILV